MGKYKYITVFEEAIKFGLTKEEYSKESSKLTIFTWIANELAEANRLERLKLKIEHFPRGDLRTQETNSQLLADSRADLGLCVQQKDQAWTEHRRERGSFSHYGYQPAGCLSADSTNRT